MPDTVIAVENLSKRYFLGQSAQRDRYTALRDVISRKVRSLADTVIDFGRGHEIPHEENAQEFWAIKNINFTVKQGEVLGIIGPNGAGKSTLLKLLSRITEPTEGRIRLLGRVSSLLEVGTGFHPELTGRENIFLSGAVLGMTRQEIRKKLEEIVAFSEVERFIDTPVKRFSSGMYVRLAFAVAAHLEPDILVVDEVLAVGDAAFQNKSIGKMSAAAGTGRTVLFVSHNMGAIRSLCHRALFLNEGRLVDSGNTSDVINKYIAKAGGSVETAEVICERDSTAEQHQQTALRSIRLLSSQGQLTSTFEPDAAIIVEINYDIFRTMRGARFNLHVMTVEGEQVFSSTDHNKRSEVEEPGIYKARCTIPGNLLNQRIYAIEISCDVPGAHIVIPRRRYLSFRVFGVGNQGSYFPENWPGVVCPKLEWNVGRVTSSASQP